jgi:peptidoglycan/LPS O-acetylase OafA/YrhL
MDSEPRRRRLPELTSLRFFAAMGVVIYHLRAMGITAGPAAYQKLAGIGYAGVSFFFVLSGFILVYTYAGRSIEPRVFWRARFARIYPAYAFSLLLSAPGFFKGLHTVPLYSWAAKHLALACFLVPTALQAWLPLAALSWNAVAWSLSVEAFFYLLFPALLLLISKRSARQLMIVMLACWLVSVGIGFCYVWLKPDGLTWAAAEQVDMVFWISALKFNPLVRLPEFLAGMAGGLLFVNWKRESIRPAFLIVPALIAIGAVIVTQRTVPYPVIHNGLLAPAFIALIYGFALQPAWGAVLRQRVVVLFGDASYSLYLLHSTVIVTFFFMWRGFHMPFPLAMVVYFTVTFGLALAVYRFVEEPARRWLNPRKSDVSRKTFRVAAPA